VRDITRETVKPADARAGLTLLASAESNSELIVLMAEQVSIELSSNLQEVQQEAGDKLAKFLTQVQRINDVAAAYGAVGQLPISHLHQHVPRSRWVLDRWQSAAHRIPDNPGVTGRAFARVNAPRTPARKGKESMKDCVVVEAYLVAAQQLRAAGHVGRIVFASSNTKEYHGPNSTHLQADISSDFQAHAIEFAPNFGSAKHLLGF
jgi:hypothetical protein